MVYLYKCPFCVFGEMDSTKGCGSDDFISAAFLPVSPSISRLTEAASLNVSYRTFIWKSLRKRMQRLLIHSREFVKYSPHNKMAESSMHERRERSHLCDQPNILEVFSPETPVVMICLRAMIYEVSVQPKNTRTGSVRFGAVVIQRTWTVDKHATFHRAAGISLYLTMRVLNGFLGIAFWPTCLSAVCTVKSKLDWTRPLCAPM